MFEAHLPSADLSSQPACRHNQITSNDQLIKQIIHNSTHNCPIWVWSTHGKRKDKKGSLLNAIFLYIEYKNPQNNACYLCKELTGRSLVDNQFLTMLAESALLTNISTSKTRYWLKNFNETDSEII
jgi:hypothetical protein